jgi:hypothetical protein
LGYETFFIDTVKSQLVMAKKKVPVPGVAKPEE